jgi:hypothetical protein
VRWRVIREEGPGGEGPQALVQPGEEVPQALVVLPLHGPCAVGQDALVPLLEEGLEPVLLSVEALGQGAPLAKGQVQVI